MSNKLNIAICFRGLIRTGILNRKVFEYFFENNYNVDFFVHTWDYDNNAIPPDGTFYGETPLAKFMRDQGPWNLLSSKVTKFQQVYRPKLFIKEDIQSYWETNNIHVKSGNDFMFPLEYHPQFVSAYFSNRLRILYELKKGKKYDLVISTRPDIMLNPQDYFVEQMLCDIDFLVGNNENFGIVNLDPNFIYNSTHVDDVLYMATPKVMDSFMEFYNPKQNSKSHQFPLEYLKSKSIIPRPLPWSYTINRDWCSYLDPIDDYDTVFAENILMMSDNLVEMDLSKELLEDMQKLGYNRI